MSLIVSEMATDSFVRPIVVDSSGWLEYFSDTDRAPFFAEAADRVSSLIVPTIVLYEVYKRLRTQLGSQVADTAADYLRQGVLVELSTEIALSAASNGLPLADSIIYATAQDYNAILWTQDAHFEGMPNVKFIPKT